MTWVRAALAGVVALAVGAVLVSGGSEADPRTPAALPGTPPPFLGTAVFGGGRLTAAVDAYGDVVDLRVSGPAGRSLIDIPAERQLSGSVPADTGIVPRVRIGDRAALPMWRADMVGQRYMPGTNVVRTVARFGSVTARLAGAATGQELALVMRVSASAGMRAAPSLSIHVEAGLRCEEEHGAKRLELVCRAGQHSPGGGSADRILASASAANRRWLGRARPLGPSAPHWAWPMYRRSLLVLRALVDTRTGAAAAGSRDGWAYIWPRDAATVALALAASGYRAETRHVARFLLGLDLGAAARFESDGAPVPGRGPQGDAAGWVTVAARAAGFQPSAAPPATSTWRDLPDYQEGDPADYLANAIAATATSGADGPEIRLYGAKSAHRREAAARRAGANEIAAAFEGDQGLLRKANDPGSGLDSAAAWAVRPFALPALYPLARTTLLRLADESDRFGLLPSQNWDGGGDPWTAPTAWSAWSLAALATRDRRRHAFGRAHAERRAALHLMTALRRAATPAGALPERVDARSGVPRSTAPLAWSHAFAILALLELWPPAYR